MRLIIAILILLTIIAGCRDIAGPTQPLSGCLEWDNSSMTDPYEMLVKSRCFRLGGVGFTGAIAPEQAALQKIISRPDASTVLEQLYTQGHTAGKLYALIGLHIVDVDKYYLLAPELREDDSMVDSQGGCIIFQKKVSFIIAAADEGFYDEQLRKE
ncbi:MAG: hypothetical protein WC962_08940 [Phycisphaerae bacterium]|jgi:hypothetical protein